MVRGDVTAPLSIDKPLPKSAPRKNLDDRTWSFLVSDLGNQMIQLANSYRGPKGTSPELLDFLESINEIFGDLPRNAPVELRNRLENDYRDAIWLVTGNRPIFNPKNNGGRNPQRKIPGI